MVRSKSPHAFPHAGLPGALARTLTVSALLALITAAFSGRPVSAQTWTGTGSNTDWSLSGNWNTSGNPHGVPANDGSATLTFSTLSAATAISTIDSTWSIAELDISGTTAYKFERQGSATLLLAGVDDASSANQTFDIPISLSGDAFFTNFAAGTLTFTEGVNMGSNHLSAGSSGTISIEGAITGSYFTKTSAGTLSLTGNSQLGQSVYIGTTSLPATMTISGGAGITSNNDAYLGLDSQQSGDVTVTGSGSSWTLNTGALHVGFLGMGGLTITSGGTVNSTNGATIGEGETGTATVTGTGSTWNLGTSTLTVGNDGSVPGFVTVSGGGTVTSGTACIGNEQNSSGTVTVTGSGSAMNVNGLFYDGFNGSGNVTVSAGGTLTSGDSYLGYDNGVTGTATVTGSGSTWNTSSFLCVGLDGTGNLTISNGGVINSTGGGFIGLDEGTGIVLVTGSGSLWNMGTSALVEGYYGNGNLTIRNGGQVIAGVFDIGLQPYGTDSLEILGGNLTAESLTIGNVNVSGFLLANPTGTYASLGNGYALTLGVNNASSNLSANIIDAATNTPGGINKVGTGTLTINGTNTFTGGLLVSGGTVVLGSSGALSPDQPVIVSGSGSTLDSGTYGLSVGRSGTGSLMITNGGTVKGTQVEGIGDYGGSSGTVTVTGPASTWNIGNSSLVDGNNGTGTLEIDSGGQVISGFAYAGYYAGSSGTVTVNGSGSAMTVNGLLYDGYYGSGNVTVSGGSTLTTEGCYVGYLNGSSGTATVTGSGSIWNNTFLDVGLYGTSSVTISNGGTVNTMNDSYIGSGPTTGFVMVTGSGSLWNLGASTLYDGEFNGSLAINNGGQVTAGTFELATNSYSSASLVINGGNLTTNSVTVGAGTMSAFQISNPSGANGLLAGGYALTLGGDNSSSTLTPNITNVPGNSIGGGINKVGTGTLTITGTNSFTGATLVSGGTLLLGSSGALSGNLPITVSGSGSTLDSGSYALVIGNTGKGSLMVSGGGTANSTNSAMIGDHSGSSGSVTVTGAGSTWNIGSGLLYDGYDGAGSLTISNGGTVTGTSNEFLGYDNANSTGAVTVTGAGSVWNLGNAEIFDGYGGTGSLTIGKGAQVIAGGLLAAAASEATGSLVINGGNLTAGSIAPGEGNFATFQISNPTGTNASLGNGYALTLGRDNSNSYITADIANASGGAGGIDKEGTGALTLLGANTFSGGTLVNGGEMVLGAGTDSTAITVSSGATLYVTGGTILTNGGGFGILRCNSGGTVTFDNATVNGGSLTGAGTFTIASGGATFNSLTANTTNALAQSGALTMNSVTLESTLNNNASLAFNDGLVTSKGAINAASGVTDSFSNVEVDGKLNIAAGATVNNADTSLVMGGGSQLAIGSKASPGGTLDLGGQTLELNGGFLTNNGTIQNGLVDVNYGATAKGGGTYAGGYSVNYGGKIIFGNSPGTLTSGSATWNGGATLAFQIDNATGAAGSAWGDSLVNGSLTLAGSTSSKITIALTSLLPTGGDTDFGALANFDPTKNYVWDYVDTTGGIQGFAASNFFIDTSGFTAYNVLNGGSFSVVQTGKDLYIDYTAKVVPAAAPEPSSLLLILPGGMAFSGGVALSRRRVRRGNAKESRPEQA